MLSAKRDLELPQMPRKLDKFDLLMIDYLGYMPQRTEESEVLFTLFVERYERWSLGNMLCPMFSQWRPLNNVQIPAKGVIKIASDGGY